MAMFIFTRGTTSPEPPDTLSCGGPDPRVVRVAHARSLCAPSRLQPVLFAVSVVALEERGSLQQFAHHEALGERRANLRAELRVPALDQSPKSRRRQPGRHGIVADRRKLRPKAVERGPLAFI